MRTILLLTLAGCAAAVAGCGVPRGEILVGGPAAPVWPAPPEQPRIMYLGEIGRISDLHAGKSGWQRFVDTVLGSAHGDAGVVLPYGLIVDEADQVLYVADSSGKCVHRFGLVDREYAQFDLSAEAARPVGIAQDELGKLYVTDVGSGTILVLDKNGKLLDRFMSEKMGRPTGIAFCRENGLIYVADTGKHQVLAFTRQGEVQLQFGLLGVQPGQFNFPVGLCVHGGRVYVCDTLNFRLQVFDLAGNHIQSFGEEGDSPGQFSQPKGVAVDAAGNVCVLDAHFENVQIFSPEGRLLMAFGQEGQGSGEFWLPNGICIDDLNRIFVSDPYNRRIQVFQLLQEQQDE